MTEQQEKLKAILERAKETRETLEKLDADRAKATEFLLKLQGSLETFEMLGISLPSEGEEALETEEATEPSVESKG